MVTRERGRTGESLLVAVFGDFFYITKYFGIIY